MSSILQGVVMGNCYIRKSSQTWCALIGSVRRVTRFAINSALYVIIYVRIVITLLREQRKDIFGLCLSSCVVLQALQIPKLVHCVLTKPYGNDSLVDFARGCLDVGSQDNGPKPTEPSTVVPLIMLMVFKCSFLCGIVYFLQVESLKVYIK